MTTDRPSRDARQDEHDLWDHFGELTAYDTPREAGDALGMSHKRIDYLCEKWSKAGIYDYGVCVDLGWKVQR